MEWYADFAFIVETLDLSKYNYLEVPGHDTWGVLMRKDCPLADKSVVEVSDILSYPVFCSEQSEKVDLPRWCGEQVDQLNVMDVFNLSGNAAVFEDDRNIHFGADSEIEGQDGKRRFSLLSYDGKGQFLLRRADCRML